MKTQKPIHLKKLTTVLTAALALAVWPGDLLGAEEFSDFNDGIQDWDGEWQGGDGSMIFTETGGQLKITSGPGGYFGSVDWHRSLPVLDGQTLELRVDLVSMNPDTMDVWLVWGQADDDDTRGYFFRKGQNSITVAKLIEGDRRT